MSSLPKTRVIVTHRQVGFHRWPNAPAEVEYLASEHRHLFAFRVECSVKQADREIEFHTLQRALRVACTHWENPRRAELMFGAMSCEMIALELYRMLPDFPVLAIEVWEDDECGARVEW